MTDRTKTTEQFVEEKVVFFWWARGELLAVPVEMSGDVDGIWEARNELAAWTLKILGAGGEITHRCITRHIYANGVPVGAVDVEGYR